MQLIAPPEFFALTEAQLDDICNGCGAKGSRLPIPDSFWGLSMTPACNAHDFAYHLGKDKARSDAVFFANMLLIIEDAYETAPAWQKWAGISWTLRLLRRRMAWIYYLAVCDCGGSAFAKAGQA